MNEAYALLAMIQDRIGGVLRDGADGLLPRITALSPLLAQLQDAGVDIPDGLVVAVDGLLDLDDLIDNDAKGKLLDRLHVRASTIAQGFLDGNGPGVIRASVTRILEDNQAVDLRGVVLRQASIAVSFVTTLRSLANPALIDGIRQGWSRYFFGPRGFVTVDGIAVVPPDQLGALAGSLRDSGPDVFKSLLGERKAERWIRDLIRVLVEVVGDARYGNLGDRYETLRRRVGPDNQEKAARWFKGVAGHAESLVTSAVEETVLGVAQFQTNPLIAAAAGTFAGTAARKAAQHVFLAQVGV